MTVHDRDELADALDAGDFDKVLDTQESEWIDFKQSPYRLSEPLQQFELAKDVSAMANHRGGVIVVGYGTELNPSNEEERANELRPVPHAMFEPRKIRQVVRELTIPELHVEVRWFPLKGGTNKGVGTISVEPLNERLRPALVRKAIIDDDAKGLSDRAVAVFARTGSDNYHIHAALIQELMRRGNSGDGGDDRHGRPILGLTDTQEPTPREQLTADISACSPEPPFLWVQAQPVATMTVDWLLGGSRRDVEERLVTPPQLRANGFNLDFGGDVEPLPGGAKRKGVAGLISLSVRPSGVTTLVVGYRYLGWAMDSDRRSPKYPAGTINQLAMAEFILEFCRFAFGIVAPEQTQHLVAAGIQEQSESSAQQARLFPGPLREWMASEPRAITGERQDFQVEKRRMEQPPETFAAELLKGIYLEFGFGTEDVPYLTDGKLQLPSE